MSLFSFNFLFFSILIFLVAEAADGIMTVMIEATRETVMIAATTEIVTIATTTEGIFPFLLDLFSYFNTYLSRGDYRDNYGSYGGYRDSRNDQPRQGLFL